MDKGKIEKEKNEEERGRETKVNKREIEISRGKQ